MSVYVLVPFLTAYFYKKSKRRIPMVFTYLFAGVLIFMYPFFIFQVDDWLNPPVQDYPRCGMWEFGVLLGNCILMIPATQLLLFLFHLLFKNKTTSDVAP